MIARNVATSKKLSSVSFMAESLYYRGLPFLDDAGVMTADLYVFRATVIPLGKNNKQISITKVDKALNELAEAGLVDFCKCDSKRCMQYTNFGKFQTMKKDRDPKIDCLDSNGFHRIPPVSLNLTKPNLTEPNVTLDNDFSNLCQQWQEEIEMQPSPDTFRRLKKPLDWLTMAIPAKGIDLKPPAEIISEEISLLATKYPGKQNIAYLEGTVHRKLEEQDGVAK